MALVCVYVRKANYFQQGRIIDINSLSFFSSNPSSLDYVQLSSVMNCLFAGFCSFFFILSPSILSSGVRKFLIVVHEGHTSRKLSTISVTCLYKDNIPMRAVVSYIEVPAYKVCKKLCDLVPELIGFWPQFSVKKTQ